MKKLTFFALVFLLSCQSGTNPRALLAPSLVP